MPVKTRISNSIERETKSIEMFLAKVNVEGRSEYLVSDMGSWFLMSGFAQPKIPKFNTT